MATVSQAGLANVPEEEPGWCTGAGASAQPASDGRSRLEYLDTRVREFRGGPEFSPLVGGMRSHKPCEMGKTNTHK